MKSSHLIDLSLKKTVVEKAIVCLGFMEGPQCEAASPHTVSYPLSRAAAACRVGAALLDRCRPSLSDIHNPDVHRLRARDAQGAGRPYYAAYTTAVSSRRRTPGGLRRPQQWDSTPVANFNGVWCDRLLLGDVAQPHRTALLCPTVPPALQPEALQRVGQSHHQLKASDVLLVDTTPALPFGVVRLWPWDCFASATPRWGGLAAQRRIASCGPTAPLPSGLGGTLEEAFAYFASSELPTVLALGCGATLPPTSPFTPEEDRLVVSDLVPLAAFTAALWTLNATIAAEYVEKQTPDANSLSRLENPQRRRNARLWSQMQAAMLSTRDTMLLLAHFTQTRLDSRLSIMHQTYLAETLLRRLEEGVHQREDTDS